MPFCYKCKQPIFFAREKPEYRMIGTYVNPKEIVTDPRPKPININPDNLNGTIAIFESRWPASNPAKERFACPMYNEHARAWLRSGGVLYRSHFDTCQGFR